MGAGARLRAGLGHGALESLLIEELPQQVTHEGTAVDPLAAGPSYLGVDIAVQPLQQAIGNPQIDDGGRLLRRTAYGAFARFFLAHGYPSHVKKSGRRIINYHIN